MFVSTSPVSLNFASFGRIASAPTTLPESGLCRNVASARNASRLRNAAVNSGYRGGASVFSMCQSAQR